MRMPAAAGSFYPGSKSEIEEMVADCIKKAKPYVKAVACYGGVCPHAGFIYSGVPAACTFLSIKELKSAETVVIIGPNHTGIGGLISLSEEDWELPIGIFKNDVEFGREIVENSIFVKPDEEAHRAEHSIEVQLPFLQAVNPKAKIVPICMREQSLEGAIDVAKGIFAAQEKLGRKIVVIASSDFSHYISSEDAKTDHDAALRHIEKLDVSGFQKDVRANQWTICGYGPISAAALYSEKKGSKKALELMYIDSGEATGDYSQVVGYASIVFPR